MFHILPFTHAPSQMMAELMGGCCDVIPGSKNILKRIVCNKSTFCLIQNGKFNFSNRLEILQLLKNKILKILGSSCEIFALLPTSVDINLFCLFIAYFLNFSQLNKNNICSKRFGNLFTFYTKSLFFLRWGCSCLML